MTTVAMTEESDKTVSFGTTDWLRASERLVLTAYEPRGRATISAFDPWDQPSELVGVRTVSRLAPRSLRTSKRDR